MKQKNLATRQLVLASRPSGERKTFSEAQMPYVVLSSQQHLKQHTWEELSSQGECGQLGYSFQQSQRLASVLEPLGKFLTDKKLRQDSGCVGDTLVSMLYDILFYILNVRSVGVAYSHFTVSPPQHSSTGRARCFL